MAARHALIAIAVALAMAGCQVAQRVPPILVVTRSAAPSVETFESLVQAALSAGYQVLESDEQRGTFRLRAYAIPQDHAHAFVVQCYASGHVEIVPVGPRVTRIGADYVMPPALRRELIALAQSLSGH